MTARRGRWSRLRGWSACALLFAACQSPVEVEPPAPPAAPEAGSRLRTRARSLSPVAAPPADPTNALAGDERAVLLGQALFFQPGMSGHGDFSCASCHLPEKAFTDGLPVSLGRGLGTRNAPTVLDSAHERWLFRDGRADTLWSQALQPIEDPVEMGGSRAGVVRTLLAEPVLRAFYDRVFGGDPGDDLADLAAADLPGHARPVPEDDGHPHAVAWAQLPPDSQARIDRVFANVGKALAAYERRLLSGPSGFDRWAAGDDDALTESAVRGFALFVGRAGCQRCHPGPRFTDGEFHNLGVPPSDGGAPRDPGRFQGARRLKEDAFASTGPHSDAPQGGRSLATRTLRVSGEDWGAFKTPSLRNVARTPPYMHAGEFGTLHEVVRFYSTLEGAMTGGHHAESTLQPADLSDEEIADLVAFLESLSGTDPPAELLAPPASP